MCDKTKPGAIKDQILIRISSECKSTEKKFTENPGRFGHVAAVKI